MRRANNRFLPAQGAGKPMRKDYLMDKLVVPVEERAVL